MGETALAEYAGTLMFFCCVIIVLVAVFYVRDINGDFIRDFGENRYILIGDKIRDFTIASVCGVFTVFILSIDGSGASFTVFFTCLCFALVLPRAIIMAGYRRELKIAMARAQLEEGYANSSEYYQAMAAKAQTKKASRVEAITNLKDDGEPFGFDPRRFDRNNDPAKE